MRSRFALVLLLALTACPGRSLPEPNPSVLFGLPNTTSPGASSAVGTPGGTATPATRAPTTLPPGGTVPFTTTFVSSSTGFGVDYACRPASSGVDCAHRASVSRDGGTTWKSTGRPIQARFDRERAPGITFISERQGWIYGGALFQTNDAAATWSRISTPTPGNDPCGLLPEPVSQFLAAGRDHWAVAGDCSLGRCPGVYTNAGGRGQMCRADPRSPLQSARLLITAQAVFVLIGEGRSPATVARTLNGGWSWNLREAPCGIDSGATLAAVGKTRVWLACYDEPVTGMQSGRIYENPDFGEAWFVRSDTGTPGSGGRARVGNLPMDGHAGHLLALPNAELVLTRSKFGSIHRSRDGGRTWTVALNNSDVTGFRVQFLDAQTGWAHSGSGLHGTTDGGRTWRLLAGTTSA